MLGGQFQVKVRGSYIILQPASEKTAHKSSIEFTGEVVDARTGQRLANTSVYEVNNLSSTLSGDDGSYKLSTFFQDGITAFAISKENYRDTVIRIANPQIEPVKIQLQPLEKETEPRERNLLRWIDSLNLVRFLVNRKAKAHMRNVQMVEQRWVQVSLLPVVGSNGLMGGKIGNNVSLNIMAGYNHSVEGAELGGFFNIDRMGMKGLQAAGFGNVVGGKVAGAQLSGFVNLTPGGVVGTQLTGFVNHAGTRFAGFQGAGFMNVSNSTVGVQASGTTNFTLLDVKGVQATGFVNIVGGTMEGVQASGFMNVAGTVKGLQIGVVNVAKRVEKGATIGLLNLVQHGFHEFDISTNDVTTTNLTFRSGTQHFYTIFLAGVKSAGVDLWSAGMGIGTQVSWGEKLYTDIELSSHTIQPMEGILGEASDDYRLQINIGYKLKNWASINAGPIVHFYNYSTSEAGIDFARRFGNRPFADTSSGLNAFKAWVGYSAAIRLF